jgi:transcriptional regulator with XRE-family HTH domain
MRYYSNDEIIALALIMRGERSQKALAKELGISEPYLSDFLNGRRDAGPAILKALGFDHMPFYRKAGKSHDRPSNATRQRA